MNKTSLVIRNWWGSTVSGS